MEQGALEICKALYGTYQVNGRAMPVNGDMTKVKNVVLSPGARTLLNNIEHVSKKQPGTQEVRRHMRFETNAHRVRYGVPIFVTFTPDEGHNRIMLRMSRTRRKDPVFVNNRDPVGRFVGQRLAPVLVGEAEDVFSMCL